MKTLILAVISLLCVAVASADDDGISQKARLRNYDGGIDEQPLQVQANLYNPKVESERSGEGDIAPTDGDLAPSTVDEAPASDGE